MRARGSTLLMPLEGLAGSHVKDVAAKRFGMGVTLEMNGTHLVAFPHTTLAEIRKSYEAQLRYEDTPNA